MADYDLLAKFYDRLMADPLLRSRQVMRCIERYHPAASSLLELGCGTAAVLNGLSALDSLAGLDISPNMLDLARARLPGAEFIEGDISSFDLGRRFDVIVCTYDVLNHLTDCGLFIFDVNTVGHLDKETREQPQVHEFDGNLVVINVSAEERPIYLWGVRIFEHVADDQFRLHQSQFREFAVEIRHILGAMPADFTLLDLSDPTGGAPDDESERAFFVYRRQPS